MIKILVIQPDKEPYTAEIEPNTEGISPLYSRRNRSNLLRLSFCSLVFQ